jgi:phospholipase/lecithinase/hemolysin
MKKLTENTEGRKTYAMTAALVIYVVASNIMGQEVDPNIIAVLGGGAGLAMRAGMKKPNYGRR